MAAPPTTSTRGGDALMGRFGGGSILAVTALLAPMAAASVPLALAPLTVLAAVLCAAAALRGRRLPPPPPVLGIILGAAILWGAISLAWSLDPWASLRNLAMAGATLLAVVMVVASALDLERLERRRVTGALIVGTALGAAYLVFEWLSGGVLLILVRPDRAFHAAELSAYSRGVAALTLFVWPCAAALTWRAGRLWGLAALVVGAVIAAIFISGAAKLAFAVGIAVFVAALANPRRVGAALGTVLVVGTLAAPLIPAYVFEPLGLPRLAEQRDGSIFHRLRIWRFAAIRIAERPLGGWGFDSSRRIPGGKDSILAFGEIRPDTARMWRHKAYTGAAMLPLHPHNAALQMWLELGVPGGVGLAALLLLMVARITGRVEGRLLQSLALGHLATVSVLAFSVFGIWQSWWLGGLALSAAATMILAVPRAPPADQG